MNKFPIPKPLKITCTSTDCSNDLHCFKQKRQMTYDQRGRCRECGADLVNWERIHQRDIGDAKNTFKLLKYELIRHYFFHETFDDLSVRHALRKGRSKLNQAARERLMKYLAPAEPIRDGRQTPFFGNAIFYAQHATATCCRTCLEYWHGIPKGRSLSESELEYSVQLIELFFDERLPHLQDDPVYVPRRPHSIPPDIVLPHL